MSFILMVAVNLERWVWWEAGLFCPALTPRPQRLVSSGLRSRRGHTVLKIHLPAKEENVILVRLSQIQRDLYTQFMDRFRDCGSSGWLGLNPLKAFCVCCKVRGGLRDPETWAKHAHGPGVTPAGGSR